MTLQPTFSTAKAAPRRRRSPSISSNPTYSRMNNRLALVLLAIILLSPLPLGSHRPVWWMVWGIVIGLATAIYMLSGRDAASDRPLRLHYYRGILLAVLPVPLFALLQSLPFAGLLPTSLISLPDAVTAALPNSMVTISIVPGTSLVGALRSVIFGLFFLLMLETASQSDRIRRISFVLFLGVAAHAVLGLVLLKVMGDTALWGDKEFSLGAATAGFVNRNSFATFLGFGLCLGIATLMERADLPQSRTGRKSNFMNVSNMENMVLGTLVGLILLALLATQSRLGLVSSLAGGILTFVLMQARRKVGRFRLIAQASALVLVTLVATFGLEGGGVVDRLLFLAGDTEGRMDIYRQMLTMIAARPLTGFGWDAFAPAFELFRTPPVLIAAEVNMGHNTYLTLWVELGLVVGSLPLVALAMIARRCIQNYRRRTSLLAPPVAAMGAMLTAGLHSFGDFSLEIQANVFLFLAILALGIARHRGETDVVAKAG